LSYDRNALNIANLSPFFELEPMAGKEPLGNTTMVLHFSKAEYR